MVDPKNLLSRLAQHRSLGNAPAAEHEWLVTHGTPRTYAAGEVVTAKGEAAKRLLVLFDGHLVIRMDRGAGSHKIFEWRGGDVGGVMPYSRGASPPNDVVAEEPTDILTIDKELLPEMIRECPTVTATLVHTMVDRARQFTSSDLRDEKLVSLGKLSSGLAHELNNPAAAVMRNAKLIAEHLGAAEDAARRFAGARLTDVQFTAIDALRNMCTWRPPGTMSAVARADREDEIGRWLAGHGVDESFAAPLVETGVTIAALDQLADSVTSDALDATVQWISASRLVRDMASDVEKAATRIYELVAAVKGFSYMDRAPTAEPVNIRQGIADTLTMLGAKLRGKGVEVKVDIPHDLPHAVAVGAELNQVWMNLIDNAIDAVAEGGHVTVSATRDLDHVSVSIVDDGPGIPADIKSRIFDPFFTTKGVGKGTGLGLDIVRRLMQRHDGEVSVESAAGRTEFQIRIPAEKQGFSAPVAAR